MAITKATASSVAPAAKGDLVVGSATNDAAVLAVGSADQVLTVDSSTSTGLKWAAAAGGAFTSIATGSLSGASTSITSIPGTYTDLYLVMVNARPATDGRGISVQMNGDNTASRHTQVNYSANNTDTTFNSNRWNAVFGSDMDNSVTQSLTIMRIYNYANTTTWKIGDWAGISNNSTTTTNPSFARGLGGYNQTSAITSLTIFDTDGGNLGAGTYTLYGVK